MPARHPPGLPGSHGRGHRRRGRGTLFRREGGAMLEVNFRGDPETLLNMGSHDAKVAEAVLLELLAQISLVCGASKLRWKLYQAQPTSNSFSLHGPGQTQFHFRANTGGGGIKVYDRPSQGKQVATITSRNEARDFVKTQVAG